MNRLIFIVLIIIFLCSCSDNTNSVEKKQWPDDIAQISYLTINRFPHDISSFTEGLFVYNGQLFESTGSPNDLYQTKSILGIVDLQTGKIDKKAELNRDVFFGEGIVLLKNKIYQLTYKNQICFVYDAKTFKKIGQFSYSNRDGWGLTTDGIHLIMSDGTNVLSYIEPTNFHVVRKLSVSANSRAVNNLNELEYINGFIYANVWPTNNIVKIDTTTGHVVGRIDLTPLKKAALSKNPKSFETNGIAYDATSDKIYVTGKMWPEIYQIDFIH